jgi:SAM-dependent methyltransferase
MSGLVSRFVLWFYRVARLATVHQVDRAVELLEEEMARRDERVRYLLNEVSDLRALVRFLLPESANYRRYVAQTRASFDYQWANLTEGAHLLGDESFKKQALETLEKNTGLARDWFRGKKVLDAGCGNGRWSWTLSQAGAVVTSIDQSAAGVESVRKICAGSPGFEAKQHDLLQPLGMSGAFDFVWCFGVIHHTGDTWLALRNVADAVKEGGLIYLMVYGEPRWEEFTDFHGLNEWVALRRTLRTMSFDERVSYLAAHKKKEEVHGWFDALSPEINDLHRFDEIAEWLRALGFVDVKRTFGDRNLHVVARRSAGSRAP